MIENANILITNDNLNENNGQLSLSNQLKIKKLNVRNL